MANVVLLLKYVGSTVLLFLVTAGWGEWLLRALRASVAGYSHFLDRVWLGVATITLALQIWHLFFPVDVYAALLIAVVGVLGAVVFVRQSRTTLWRQSMLLHVALIGLVSLPIYFTLPGPPAVYDNGMYHLQSIRWMHEYPVVPGLAHLNIQFATNQISFLWCALLNVPGLQPFGYTYLNAFLLLAAIAYSMRSVVLGLSDHLPPSMIDIFQLFTLPVYAVLSVNTYAESPSPDFMAWILVIMLFGRMVVLLAPESAHLSPLRSRCLFPSVLATLCVMVKFSTVLFALLVYGTVALILLTDVMRERSITRTMRKALPVIAFVLLMLSVWTLGGVVQTGYALFPFSATRLNTDWSLDERKVDATRWYIGTWGRVSRDTPSCARRQAASYFEAALASSNESIAPPIIPYFSQGKWLKDWVYAVSCNPIVQHAALITVASLLATVLFGMGFHRRIFKWRWLWGGLILVVCITFCYLSAPALRFMLPYILLLVPWGIAWFWCQLPDIARRSIITPGAIALAAACLIWLPDARKVHLKNSAWSECLRIPCAKLVKKMTDSGLTLTLPRKGMRVYNAPLPATPYYNRRLKLRDSTKGLRGGFMVGDFSLGGAHINHD